MYLHIFLLLAGIKVLFIPYYHSTDFEVHRNWLAITNSLPLDKWYYENRSEWTLDYPPLFAWFEYGLSQIAKHIDSKMLNINNLYYASNQTVIFQRASVIVTDIIFAIGVKRCSDLLDNGRDRFKTFILIFCNVGLLMVDHIHFQYNGFLFGILLLSISDILRGNYILSAFWFSVLLNLKHIYLYIAPVYFIYLLRVYCFTVTSKEGSVTLHYSLSVGRLVKLATVVIFVFGVSFGPFHKQLPQIFSRLFPFKRGLSHSYWAPNFWALYNTLDKVLVPLGRRLGFNVITTSASMTAGLVQEYQHVILPSIKPIYTFVLTIATMIPALVKLWHLCADKNMRVLHFLRCISLCAACSFMFGWHVHEKAILIIIIPLSFAAVLNPIDGEMFLFLSTIGHFSLFPLLYPRNLLTLKCFLLLTYTSYACSYIPNLYPIIKKKTGGRRKYDKITPFLNEFESFSIYGIVPMIFYTDFVHFWLGHDKILPFLPLMLTSVYCALCVTYFWIKYYYHYLKSKPTVYETVPSQQTNKKCN